ncbi:hypothetical protein [Stratiformator vulcanicus]|uniref:Tetratricopeptide repeat protein n=1 Tax=Stratiformator vulcanicus TaxID=2527980 RepID=A0A517QZX5_9PLAN|nr:hypothetical protein [Stratiformator vulcanicus]QDT37199.1 hypothetical protein Pan189_15710 [Stratiformator vulcanicus]
MTSSADDPQHSPHLDETKGGDAPTVGADSASEAASTETLPDDADLTPEYLAEEAQRNDFVLRWLFVLLAIICASMTVADSAVLRHAKFGETLASNGLVPTGVDSFSATADGHSWLQRSWLFDLVSWGAYSAAGPAGWTILAMIGAGFVAWLLVSTRRVEVDSWWVVVASALALPAIIPQLVATPELITLCGTATTLWLLWQYRLYACERKIWLLVLVMLLWGNMDPRAFLGLSVLLLYGVGEAIGAAIGRAGFFESGQRRTYWIVTACCVLAFFISPFGWQQFLAPVELYGSIDAAFRDYFGAPKTSVREYFPVWAGHLTDLPTAAGLFLGAVALVTIGLNGRRLDPGDILLTVGFFLLGLITRRELAPAALVFAAVASWNGQSWRRAVVRTEDTIRRADIVFARGGRLVTAIALISCGLVVLSGRVPAFDSRSPGFGLSIALETAVAGYKDAVAEAYDARMFNFRPAEGDVLIWVGAKPFIDTRLGLYQGSGDDDLLSLHNTVRYSMLAEQSSEETDESKTPRRGRPEIWKQAFDRFSISQAINRLSQPDPDYFVHFDLLTSPEWRMTVLNAAASVFCRADGDEEFREYVRKNSLNFIDAAFRQNLENPETRERAAWGTLRSGFEQGLIGRDETIPAELALAGHFLKHLESGERQGPRLGPEIALAFCYLAIRNANEFLMTNPDSNAGYKSLGLAYHYLGLWETRIAEKLKGSAPRSLRFYESLNALGQARVIKPDEPELYLLLYETYVRNNRLDLALDALTTHQQLTGEQAPEIPDGALNDANKSVADAVNDIEGDSSGDPPNGESASEALSQLTAQDIAAVAREKARKALRDRVSQVETQVYRAIAQDAEPFNVATAAWQQGFTLLALRLIDESYPGVERPELLRFKALLLLEAARPAEAYAILTNLVAERPIYGLGEPSPLLEPYAMVSVGLGQYQLVTDLWLGIANDVAERSIRDVLFASPLMHLNIAEPPVIKLHDEILNLASRTTAQVGSYRLNAALSELEAGRVEEARELFAQVASPTARSSFTPLARFYLLLTGGELPKNATPSNEDVLGNADLFGQIDQTDESAAEESEPKPQSDSPEIPSEGGDQVSEDGSAKSIEDRPAVKAPRPDGVSSSDETEADESTAEDEDREG